MRRPASAGRASAFLCSCPSTPREAETGRTPGPYNLELLDPLAGEQPNLLSKYDILTGITSRSELRLSVCKTRKKYYTFACIALTNRFA